MNILEVEKLTKRFGEITAVNELDFQVTEGEIFGLLGPSGSGKSTTINLLCGLIAKDEGQITILGKDIGKEANAVKKDIGLVPQDLAMYGNMTAFENVKFFTGLYGFRGKELEKRVEDALEFVGLTDRKNGLVKEFSLGLKRRLNIACSIAHRPQILIMDEPTLGVDSQSRKYILEAVKMLNRQGCTILYTSHYMAEVEELCSRIMVLDHGKVIAEGTRDQLLSIISNTRSIWVTVQSIRNFDEDSLKNIEGILGVDVEDNVIKINFSHQLDNIDCIMQYFLDQNIKVRNLENKIPDFETVFLMLTGRNLRG